MAKPSGRSRRVTTSHWGAFEVETEAGQIVATHPFQDDPFPTDLPDILPAAVHHETRIARPSVRRSWLATRERTGRGTDDYVSLPWDEALDLAASEIRRVLDTYGNEAVYGGSYGWGSAGRFHHAQSQLHRFLNCLGGYVSSFGSYSTGCAQSIMPHVFGLDFLPMLYNEQPDWRTLANHTETLIMFGGINPKNAQVSMGGITRHETQTWFEAFAQKGMSCVNIGPQRTDAPDGCDWLPVRPGSDTALMLALAYVLETEGRADHDFLTRYTAGWDRFRPYLLGTSDGCPKSPEWAAPLTGVDAETIRQLARRMARSRCFITVAWSLQRGQYGEQPFWMSAVLAAMLGQIGLPGGGVGYGYGAIGGVGKTMKPLRGMTFDQFENPIKTRIPVARIADMLLQPGALYDFNGTRQPYPDIRLIYWAGGNPFHHHQDLNRLSKAWQRPETVIVHEPWWTATAKRADIVFPATTPYEREDIGRSPLDDYVFHMAPLIPPVGDARDDYAILSGLADRLNISNRFTEGRSASEWIAHLYKGFQHHAKEADVTLPELPDLREKNWIHLPLRQHTDPPFFLSRFRQDPDGAPLQTPSGRIELFSETIAGFGYADCSGHPVWQAPEEWLGTANADAPLHMVSPQPGDKLHSQLESALADQPGARPVRLSLHPEDAADRDIVHGDLVKVFNARGETRARAHVTDNILKGVVALPTGAWFGDTGDVDPHGNPNVLTRDVGTSALGQGCSAHTALVQVSKQDPT